MIQVHWSERRNPFQFAFRTILSVFVGVVFYIFYDSIDWILLYVWTALASLLPSFAQHSHRTMHSNWNDPFRFIELLSIEYGVNISSRMMYTRYLVPMLLYGCFRQSSVPIPNVIEFVNDNNKTHIGKSWQPNNLLWMEHVGTLLTPEMSNTHLSLIHLICIAVDFFPFVVCTMVFYACFYELLIEQNTTYSQINTARAHKLWSKHANN